MLMCQASGCGTFGKRLQQEGIHFDNQTPLVSQDDTGFLLCHAVPRSSELRSELGNSAPES